MKKTITILLIACYSNTFADGDIGFSGKMRTEIGAGMTINEQKQDLFAGMKRIEILSQEIEGLFISIHDYQNRIDQIIADEQKGNNMVICTMMENIKAKINHLANLGKLNSVESESLMAYKSVYKKQYEILTDKIINCPFSMAKPN